MRIFGRLGFTIFLLLILAFLQAIVSQLSEKEILLQFKGSVTNDPYNFFSSWAPDRDPCRNFTGVVCDSEGNVEKILLYNTSVAGVLPPSLSGLKSLQILSLFGNRFTGSIPEQFADIGTLRKLNLSENALSGEIPEFLGNLRNLRLLDLSRNSFRGEIPPSLFENCFRTRFISLSYNSLSGEVPLNIAHCFKLTGIDFSFNNLSGTFPLELCDPPNMAYISLRSNHFGGNVLGLSSVCQSLEFLDLASNSFTGLLPFDLLGLKNFSFFNASDNKFQGQMPAISTCSERMVIFDASRNNLSGEIQSSIANCRNIRVVDLGFNLLSGSIPVEVANLKMLSVLRLGYNLIGGTIPAGLGGIELLQILDLRSLHLVGEIPTTLSECRFLLELDLSGNNLRGEIPENLNNMTYLKVLDLHKNQLQGSIPSNLGELLRMQFLDLSENFLIGSIPSSLGNLTLLKHLNLSYNNLSGAIPSNYNIQQFGATAFIHNPGLCGAPLETPCSANSGNGSKSESGRTLSVSAIIAIVAAAAILTGVCVITLVNIQASRRRRDNEILVLESTPPASSDSNLIIGKLVLFSKSLPSKYEDWEAGTKALLDKDCMIGGGSIGTVYKTTFEGGISIAVKKLETLGRMRNQDEFEQEIGRLGNLHHPNLVAFHGYYWSSSMQLLLSEFIPNANLYQHLHGYSHSGSSTGSIRSELYWSRRFQIALGTAKALAYLHHDCKPQVLHLNIKSTNILLDEAYEPKLSDFGLGKLLPILDNYALTKSHKAVGYVAPELASQGLSLRFGDKCDVYSFGVILLELITGRKPVESPAATEVVILRDYVRDLLEKGLASDCFDRSLRGFSENELIQVMKLGLICTSKIPTRRPSMAEVVQVLESIQPGSDS